MNKLLSEQELRDLCAEIQKLTGHLDDSWEREFGDEKGLYGLIQSQKLLHGEMVIGEDGKLYDPSGTIKKNGVFMSPRGENQRIRNENNLRAKQRQRNKIPEQQSSEGEV